MKKKIKKFFIRTDIIFLVIAGVYYVLGSAVNRKTILFEDTSADKNYTLTIYEIGTPDWPFGSDHVKVILSGNGENENYEISFKADVANEGMRAFYEVKWLDDGVQIILIGKGQPDAYYVLPFDSDG